MVNIAYSDEYKDAQQNYEWLFNLEPIADETFCLGDNNEYIVRHFTFAEEKPRTDGMIARYAAKKVTVSYASGELLLDFKVIDDHFFVKLINHQNGRYYLVFNIDLYGYSVMDIKSGEIAHYIPKCSFNEGKETFIWTDVLYCKTNNLLAVDGCYWACQWTNEFYDFSVPMKLPLPFYADGYEMEDILDMDINNDILAIGFTDEGKCIIKGTDKDNNCVEKIFDVIGWSQNKR